MSTHADCGEDIKWVRRSDDLDRWMPPLEFAGYRYVVLEDNTAQQVPTYISHHCDPEKVIAWQSYKEQLEFALASRNEPSEQAVSNYAAARERDKERAWNYALQFACPRCEMPPGSKCIDLGKKRRQINAETVNPHPERMEVEKDGR